MEKADGGSSMQVPCKSSHVKEMPLKRNFMTPHFLFLAKWWQVNFPR